MEKLDLKQRFKSLYQPSAKQPQIVDVPSFQYFMVDGEGNPNTAESFRQAVDALYSLSYTAKFALRKQGIADYSVMPLQGLWWADDMLAFMRADKKVWKWTAMILQPECVTAEVAAAARIEAAGKKDLPALPLARFDIYHEGLAAQIMHIGPYAAEQPTIARLHEFIEANGYVRAGYHHEIYLSDPRRTAPERMKTILRQPVKARS